MPQFERTRVQPTQLWKLLKDTFTAWSDDKVPRHGAALAYYTILMLVPLLVVIIAMIGLIFGREAAQGYILEQIGSLLGPQGAAAIKEMFNGRVSRRRGSWRPSWRRRPCFSAPPGYLPRSKIL